jgi:hypothetical protein
LVCCNEKNLATLVFAGSPLEEIPICAEKKRETLHRQRHLTRKTSRLLFLPERCYLIREYSRSKVSP